MVLVAIDASIMMARRDYQLSHRSDGPLSFLALQLVGLLFHSQSSSFSRSRCAGGLISIAD
jgi:hypothetical protein